jgi:hypothetical protein
MDIDTGIDGLGHIHHGRILDFAHFSALLNYTDMIESVSFSNWDRAADYVETYFPDYTPTVTPIKKESGIASRRRELGKRATATRRVC